MRVCSKVDCVAWRFKLFFLSVNIAAKRRSRGNELSLSQAPRGFGVCYRGFPAFLARLTSLKTAKLRRLVRKKKVETGPEAGITSCNEPASTSYALTLSGLP